MTMLLLDERDSTLREAARFFPGLSDREIARRLREALSIYRDGRWRRDRLSEEQTCPLQYRGQLREKLWLILRNSDFSPSERTIRRAPAVPTHGPRAEL